MSGPEGFAAVFYSEPAVMGLLSNAVSAFLVALQNFAQFHTSIPAQGVENILAGVHLILIGGFSQLAAGLLTFRKYDHLGGTAFIVFSALWSSYGATRIILGAYPPLSNISQQQNAVIWSAGLENGSLILNSTHPHSPSITESALAGLMPYTVVAFILSFCSATVNYIMPFVFGAITLTLVFEAVGLFGQWGLVVSGILELVIVIFGLYGAKALLFKGITQKHVLPGFGNPLFNVLLLGTGNRSSSKMIGEEKKKNTKYAEPMGLGNMCEVIAPFIFAFYSFGYMNTFYVGAIWVSIISIAQLLSSYYSYLRDDAYFTTKLGVHSLYWLVRSWEEFTLTVLIKSTDLDGSRAGIIGDWFFLATACILCVMSLNRDLLELAHNCLFVLLTISTISQIPIHGSHLFFGVICCIYTALSLYKSFASLINSIAEKALVPTGIQVMLSTTLQKLLFRLKSFFTNAEEFPCSTSTQLPDALFYICNGLASLSAIQVNLMDPTRAHLTIPWVLIPGTLLQLFVARIEIRGSRRFGSILPFCYAAIWAIWTWLRLAGPLLNMDYSSLQGFTAGAGAFLVVNVFLIILAAFVDQVLLSLTVIMEVIIVCFLLFTIQHLPLPLEITAFAIFSLICAYGALASLGNCIFGKQLLPLGFPVLKEVPKIKAIDAPSSCLSAHSHLTSGLRTIAKLLDMGEVCGIPTDTVYALAASCQHPKAIEKIYNIKERPQEKPICIFISSLGQLAAAHPPFSSMLWEFMRSVYPGGIGCIIKKGEWLKKLGVGAAYDYVGTKDSIMIRIPDHTVTAHLVDMTGPLAITSANPSGEPDSTHHDMVFSCLGHKIKGVLCDGDSSEVVASTVVNCTRIEEGVISIVREGCIPAAIVTQIFEKVKNQLA